MSPRYSAIALAAALLLAPLAASAQALDTPTVTTVARGHGKITLDVTAGPSGAPNGFAMYWMTYQDYEDYGSVWPDLLSYPTLRWAFFTGAPTLNTFEQYDSFILGPNETIRVEIGDLNGETGVNTNLPEELTDATWYVVCTFAIGGAGRARSDYSENAEATLTTQGDNCTYTIGYWKNHEEDWPVNSLTLGSVVYTKAQLLAILNQPVAGNGLISLAHQLIGAKLNIAAGADPSVVAVTISAADAQIGALVIPPVGAGYLHPSTTSSKTQALDDYNNGITGPGHCGGTPSVPSSWGRIKSLYR